MLIQKNHIIVQYGEAIITSRHSNNSNHNYLSNSSREKQQGTSINVTKVAVSVFAFDVFCNKVLKEFLRD